MCRAYKAGKGAVTVPLVRGETTVIFKNVPADVCQNCGEYYLDETTTQNLLEYAEEAVKRGAEIEVIRLAA
ncbi:MAG: type II toxin-antitoxin system MqsA family antitoxin [Mariprofundaceae bacterium]|nr:type II toxin-antitoxin system MqsA family antitoxin [Mariprofundaceae bacterium]